MFVNKLRTSTIVKTGIACFAIMVGAAVPFYAYAIGDKAEEKAHFDEEMVCYDAGEQLLLVEMRELETLNELKKPNCVMLDDKGMEKNYLVGDIDCGTFLMDLGVELTHNDVVNLDADTALEGVSVVNVDRIEYKTEQRTEQIPYETTEIGIDTIPKGERQLVSAGTNGLVTRTYLVRYVNGEAADEAVYTETILSEPVNEVVNVGVGGTVTAKDGTVYNYSYRKQMEATAYTYLPPYTTMTTATGQTLRKGIVAVDPSVIPLHTKMFITGSVEYGLGVAEDTGGAIKGNIVDLAYMSYDECINFGRRQMEVYILE